MFKEHFCPVFLVNKDISSGNDHSALSKYQKHEPYYENLLLSERLLQRAHFHAAAGPNVLNVK